MDTFALCWLALLIVFLVIEGATVTMVSTWFAGGALVAMFAALLGAQLWLQAVLFLAVSALLLLLLRPLARKHFTPKLTKTNIDALVGATGVVIEDVDNVSARGRVKLGGMEWSARSESGEALPAGRQVQVARIEGVKVFVKPVAVPEEVH